MNLALGFLFCVMAVMVRANNSTMANKLRFSGIGVVKYVATKPHSSGKSCLTYHSHSKVAELAFEPLPRILLSIQSLVGPLKSYSKSLVQENDI